MAFGCSIGTTRRVSVTEKLGEQNDERCHHILGWNGRGGARRWRFRHGTARAVARERIGFLRYALSRRHSRVSRDPSGVSVNDVLCCYVDLVEHGLPPSPHQPLQFCWISLIARKLGLVATVLCASPGYLNAKGVPGAPRHLLAHNCLVYTHAARQNVWHFFDRNGAEQVIWVSGDFYLDGGRASWATRLASSRRCWRRNSSLKKIWELAVLSGSCRNTRCGDAG